MSFLLKKTNLWALAVGGFASLACFSTPSAQAAACVNQTITAGFTGYVCDLGDVQYTFGNDLGEFTGGQILFTDGAALQEIEFLPATPITDPIISFTLGAAITAPNTITKVTSSPTFSGTIALDTLEYPAAPQANPFSSGNIIANFIGTGGALSSYSLNITKTPGPLPILGAGAAFGMSRKLRRRITQVS
jgi:hypothetical protein